VALVDHVGRAALAEPAPRHVRAVVVVAIGYAVLVAVGRTPNVSGFGLEELGVELTPGKPLAVDEFLVDPLAAPVAYDHEVGERFDAFLRTGRRFSFVIGHPLLLRSGLRVAVGTQTAADITLAVMGNLVDSTTKGAAGRVLRLADRALRIADPLLRRTRAAA